MLLTKILPVGSRGIKDKKIEEKSDISIEQENEPGPRHFAAPGKANFAVDGNEILAKKEDCRVA